ncbi:hypothetical protein ACYPKM_04690 [Pseudomonas aeruginosa]
MTKMTGLEAATKARDAMIAAGMGRTSKLNGGELTGWTRCLGSTGFSIHHNDDGSLLWHVVVSGKPHVVYAEDEDECEHHPENMEVLFPKIQKVFEDLGLEVKEVTTSSWSVMWDDDICYNIKTNHPEWLEEYRYRKPQKDASPSLY